jgi:hypothetical protein
MRHLQCIVDPQEAAPNESLIHTRAMFLSNEELLVFVCTYAIIRAEVLREVRHVYILWGDDRCAIPILRTTVIGGVSMKIYECRYM